MIMQPLDRRTFFIEHFFSFEAHCGLRMCTVQNCSEKIVEASCHIGQAGSSLSCYIRRVFFIVWKKGLAAEESKRTCKCI